MTLHLNAAPLAAALSRAGSGREGRPINESKTLGAPLTRRDGRR